MSRVYGELFSDMGESQRTRRGTKYIRARVATWKGYVDVEVRDDETAVIRVDNLDVTLNGGNMFRQRTEIEDLTMEDLMQLIQKRFKKESAKYARFPTAEFERFKLAMEAHKIMGKLDN